MKISLKAPAKVNLSLEVLRRLPNGYHELRSVSCKLEKLFDTVTIETIASSEKIDVRSRGIETPQGKGNICYKAAERYFQEIGKKVGLAIKIQKNIPVAAGLGGGSSDAAAALLGLNRIFKNKVSLNKLIEIGAEIGKDVPWFLLPHRVVHKSGMGEKLIPVAKNFNCHFVVINPKIEARTGAAFDLLSKKLKILNNNNRANKSQNLVVGIKKGKQGLIIANLYNDFEIIQEERHPVIKEIKQYLLAFGADGALMSGSGSTVFGMFFEKRAAEEAYKNIKRMFPNFVIHCE